MPKEDTAEALYSVLFQAYGDFDGEEPIALLREARTARTR